MIYLKSADELCTIKYLSLAQLQKMLTVDREQTFCFCGDIDFYYCADKYKPDTSRIMVAYAAKLGYYIQYCDLEQNRYFLSLWDRKRLLEVIDYDTDRMASPALFVPIEETLPVILYWAETGKMSDTITWIDPDSESDIGNW